MKIYRNRCRKFAMSQSKDGNGVSLFLIILFFVCINNVLIAQAQSSDSSIVCTCVDDDLSPAGMMLGHEHAGKTWKVSYQFMYMYMQDNLRETSLISDDGIFEDYMMSPSKMTMNMHMLMVMYGFTDRLSVMAMFNYQSSNMDMDAAAGHVHGGGNMSSMDTDMGMGMMTNGFGDIELYVVHQFVDRPYINVFANGGVSFPTASIYDRGEADDSMYPLLRFPYAMQQGSGSLDFMPGFTFLYAGNSWASNLQVSSIIRSNDNSLGYRLGDELKINLWGAYKWNSWFSTSARVDNRYRETISGADAELNKMMSPTTDPINSGGIKVNVYGGLNFYFNKSFLKNSKLGIEAGAPVYQKVNGIQMKSVVDVFAHWVFTF